MGYTFGGYGNSTKYLIARLERDRPDILARLKAGEYASVRQAAIEAGIRRPTNHVAIAKNAVCSLTEEQSVEFFLWLKTWLGAKGWADLVSLMGRAECGASSRPDMVSSGEGQS